TPCSVLVEMYFSVDGRFRTIYPLYTPTENTETKGGIFDKGMGVNVAVIYISEIKRLVRNYI
ncbi:MAG TPA: hypothetical protein VL947_02325, partial [Cytophagales bacterium]|nr:hypothetical protein [Cytophagales bacterium]